MSSAFKNVVSAVGAVALLFLNPGPAKADPPAPATETAIIDGNAYQIVPGTLTLNQAAGNANVQANVASFTNSSAKVPARIAQSTQAQSADGGSAFIRDFAFSNVSGLLQINQTAGSGNAQGNVAIVRIGVSAASLNDNILAGTMPTQSTHVSSNNNAAGISNAVGVAGATFRGKGIVQVNQSAGSGNATANGFLLQLQQGVTH